MRSLDDVMTEVEERLGGARFKALLAAALIVVGAAAIGYMWLLVHCLPVAAAVAALAFALLLRFALGGSR